MLKFYSQYGQDQYLYDNIFKNLKSGFYVDIGAHDGETLSNTKFFEDLGWDGICVEPIPKIYKKLRANRKCRCYDFIISDFDGVEKFLQISGYSEMLSGILKNYDAEHMARIERELNFYGGSKEVLNIKCFKFETLIDVFDIDYLSIDVEGSELKILNSIDFDKYNIKILTVENNYNDKNYQNFMVEKGYELITRISCDDVYKKIS